MAPERMPSPGSDQSRGFFDAHKEYISPVLQAEQDLAEAVSNLISIASLEVKEKIPWEVHTAVQTKTFKAIGRYCDLKKVDNEVRVQVAQAIDQLVKNGINLTEDMTFWSPHELIEQTEKLGFKLMTLTGTEKAQFLEIAGQKEEPVPEKASAQDGRFKKMFNKVFRRSGTVGSIPSKSVDNRAEESQSKSSTEGQGGQPETKKGRKIVAGLGVYALLAAGTFITTHTLVDADEVLTASKSSQARVADIAQATSTSSTTTTSTTTTSLAPRQTPIITPNQNMDVPSPIEPADVPEPPMPPEPQTVELVTIESGENVWNKLQEAAVGSSGFEADHNVPLNRTISEVLPAVSDANGSIDLGEIQPGFRLVIPQDVVERLQSTRN